MIKIAIFSLVIGSIGYIVIEEVLHLEEHSESEGGKELEFSSKDSFEIESGFGTVELFKANQKQSFKIGEASLTYTDENLGFEISKPNLSWNFNSNLDEIVKENNDQLLSNGFSGGVYVEQNNEKTFFVAVFNITEQSQFHLEEYVNTQLDYLQRKFENQVIVKAISPNNDWAIFGTKISLGDSSTYGEQLLQIHNGKLYMLQYTGLAPDKLNANDKEERRTIIDSFIVG